MELMDYIYPLIKWWRLIVVATILAGVSSFWVTLGQPLNYQSRTTMLVGSALSNPNPDSGQIYLASQLATIYAQFARGEAIKVATMEALDINWLPEYNVRVIPNSQLIEITVNDIIPERAQIINSELAKQLILLSPANSSIGTSLNRQEFIDEQLDTLQSQIIDTRDEINKLQQALGNLNSAREIENSRNQISALETKLTTLQQNYSTLLANTKEGAVNTIQIIEPATLPNTPFGPNKFIVVIVTAVTGAMIAGAGTYLLEYLRKTLDSLEEIRQEFPLQVLGEIPQLLNDDSSWTFVDKDPLSTYAEAFRKLRTNIEISTRKSPIKTILVSSATEGDGKSSIATNLAIAYSYLGRKVILVDADFRRHRIHQVLDLESGPGLSDLLAEDESLSEVIQHWKGNIFVISSGKFLNNSTELLSSPKFSELLNDLKDEADFIIIDGPPFFLSETSSLSTVVDGILVVVPIGASKSDIRLMRSQLDMIQSNVLGLVANRVGEGNYYGYYYSAYGESQEREKPKDSQVTVFKRMFGIETKKTPRSVKRLDSEKENRNIRITTPENIRQVEIKPSGNTSRESNPNTLNEKTVPRIKTPRSLLEDIILRNSMKSVDEGKEHLHDLAKKKREQDS